MSIWKNGFARVGCLVLLTICAMSTSPGAADDAQTANDVFTVLTGGTPVPLSLTCAAL